MIFGAPLALWLFALAAPVVALYLLKIKRRQVVVPYLRLWRDLVVETKARSLFQRLRRLLSLLLQIAILAAVVLAVSEPSFDLRSVKKESIVVLLDVSASLTTRESTTKTRFDLLMEKAKEIVEGRSFEDEMMLAAVSDRVEVLTPFSRSTIELRDGLERASVTQRGLDLDSMSAFAREMTAGKSDPVVVIVSDGGAGSIAPRLKDAGNAKLVTVGEARDNVAITRFATRKNEALGTDFVLAEVANFGALPRECRLEIALDGNVRKVITRSIAAGETVHEELQLSLPSGGLLQLGISVPPAEGSTPSEAEPIEKVNALALDDVAYAMVRPTRLRRVLVVTETEAEAQPFWLALTSMSEWIHESSRSVLTAEYAALSSEDKLADVTICLNALPSDLSPQSNLILLHTDMPPGVPGTIVGENPQPKVFDWDRDHELNRYLNYRDLPLPAARILGADQGTPLVSTIDGPIVASFESTTRRVIYVGFDMTAELFPFRLAFPILLRNALAWFEAEEADWFEASYPVGRAIRPLRRVADGAPVTVRYAVNDETRTETLQVTDGRFVFRGNDEIGPIEFSIGGVAFPTCVNLFDPKESDVKPPDVASGTEALAEQGRHLLNREVWVMLAALALVFWLVEWWLYHRRVTE